jgi:hypothetical protein
MPYIHFTDEQKRLAASVSLEEFLKRQGEKLMRSGAEWRLGSDHSVTVRGSRWYDHASGEGGGAVGFIRRRYGLSYADAVKLLLDGEYSHGFINAAETAARKTAKPFDLPPRHSDMRRVYAYLLQKRRIDRDVVSQFAREGLLYESAAALRGGTKTFHNLVFVGIDEHGTARHAHKRGLYSAGKSFKGNVYGSNPAYSFHRIGTDDTLLVFEAPIDLMSWITLNPQDWQSRSYVALCGVSEHALLKQLELNPRLKSVTLCLDHDAAGISATARLARILRKRGYTDIAVTLPSHKDWNEDLKSRCGLDALPSAESPQTEISAAVFAEIARLCETLPQAARAEWRIPKLFEKLCARPSAQAWRLWSVNIAEDIAALSLSAALRECRQQGETVTPRELAERLCREFVPSRNTRTDDMYAALNLALELSRSPGIRSAAQKSRQASAWLDAAAACASFAIAARAEELKHTQSKDANLSGRQYRQTM